MAKSIPTSGIRDNHTRGIVADFLKSRIKESSHLSIVSAFFTIYAYEALKDHLNRIGHMDFLFGEPRFVRSLDPDKTEKKSFIIDSAGLKLANCLQQKRIAKECADWIRDKVSIKSVKQTNFLHGKMYHISTNGVEEAILGSSNFTTHGLGLSVSNSNIELNLVVDSNIFVGGLDPNDTLHQECVPLIERIVTGEIEALCPALVLVETTCVFRRRTTVELAFNVKEALARLPSILWLDINSDVAERACVLGIRTGLRGGDALVLQVAEQYGFPLVTMDREIREKAPAGISVLEPREVLSRLS